jgi:16S rRNA A1518/A1519 N6-dimethyltransferase RsmA/KsgA/DIM1 with predicted DNA glycosylase/AP lyase activity
MMDVESKNRRRLRSTFEEVPELYDRARPGYPAQLFDDLIQLGDVPGGGRLLEIGPGTGQATLELAKRGYAVVGIELGQSLAAVARRKLAGFSKVEIIDADFEHWEPAAADFDAVVAFTAFH